MSNERGSALLVTLMTTTLLAALGVALVLTTMVEATISRSFHQGYELIYAAEAALERSLGDLLAAPDWSQVLGASASAAAAGPVALADGTLLDLGAETVRIRHETARIYGASLAASRWALYRHGPLSAVLSLEPLAGTPYTAVWVADDVNDGDLDPFRDSNGVIVVHAEAYAAGGGRRALEAVLGRSCDWASDDKLHQACDSFHTRLLSWRVLW